MIQAKTYNQRLEALSMALSTWCARHPQVSKQFPANCEVSFLRVEDGALRTLATAIYVNGNSNCWTGGEALSERQAAPDVIVCRELLLKPQGVRHVVLFPDGAVEQFDVVDDDTGYEYFKFLHGMVNL